MLNGRELRACELGAYISAYAGMFEDGARFPEATTMLDATTTANNSNASVIATNHYKDNMDIVSGVDCTEYVKEDELDETNERLRQEAMTHFDDIATFGSKSKIEDARKKVLIDCEEALVVYQKLNDGRNPLQGFETLMIPMFIGIVSITLRYVADTTCSSWSQTCRASSDLLSHVYQVVFFFLIIVGSTKAKAISSVVGKITNTISVMNGGAGSSGGNGGGDKGKE